MYYVNKQQYLAQLCIVWLELREDVLEKKQKQATINSLLLKIKYMYTCKLHVLSAF